MTPASVPTMHLLKAIFSVLTGAIFQKSSLDVQTSFANLLRLAAISGPESRVANCKCIVADDCWPSVQEWNLLNQTVRGRLLATTLIAEVCHDPTYDASACAALRAGWVYPQEQSVAATLPLLITSNRL